MKIRKSINYGNHTIDQSDVKYVSNVIKNEKLTQGSKVELFEKNLAKKFKSKYSTVVSNGSSALFLLAKALNWKKGHTIITSPITFLATANCIELCGANTKFIDIDKKNFTIDPNKVEDYFKKTKKKIKALIGVDYAGHPCDWESLRYLANKYKFTLIDDGCHAMGSKIDNNLGYALKYSDFLTQSFHPVKSITSGEGGSILSNNLKLDLKLKILRNNSMQKSSKNKMWIYKINEPGYNFRLSDIHCALGISQLKKLDFFVRQRRKIASEYNKIFSNKENLIIPQNKEKFYHSYHLYCLQINFKKIKINKDIFFKKMLDNGIKLQVHYIPLYLQPYYKKKYNINLKEFENSSEFYEKEVSIPIYPNLSKRDINLVTEKILNLI